MKNLISIMLCTFSLLLAGLSPLYPQVVINEFSCSNLTQYQDNYQKYEDWIELYNAGNNPADVSGYYLSDDSLNNLKWAFPAGTVIPSHGFLRIWTSGRNESSGGHYHTSFRLTQCKNNNEFIVLSLPSGAILDYVEISQKTQLGHSYGRTLNGAPAWSIFTAPTPNASNNTSTPYADYADRPDFSIPAGFYPSPVSVSISCTTPGADIYYTLDGSQPTASSFLYSGPVSITVTTILKAVSVSPDPEILPSFIRFETYFINENHNLVVVSVSGTNLTQLANGNGSLKPYGTFEYFNLQKQRTANTYGEFDKHGKDSWANSQRSIDFTSRDEMGYNHSVEEQLFNYSPRNNFQRLILRAAGDDNYPADHHTANLGSAHLRDAYIHSLAKLGGMNLDVRISEKTIIYLNGQYWGVYDLRERPDDHDYCDYYFGQDRFHLYYILTWGSTWAEYGGQAALDEYNNLYNYILTMNMANPANYDYVISRYDATSLVDYIIVNSMVVCSDWLNWNTGWWRGIDSTGGHLRWGYILWDNDATFGHYINYTGIPNTTPTADPCNPEALTGSSDPKGHMKVLARLRQNPEFNTYYITRQIDMFNTVFGCNNMLAQLDSTEAIIDPEMTRHAARWNGTYQEWKSNVQIMRDFIVQRCAYLPSGFINCYQLTGPYNLTIKVDPPGTGSVILNSLTLMNYPWSGTYFGNIDTRLTAYANAGYFFDHWSSNNQTFLPSSGSDTAVVNLNSSDTITAHFTLFTSAKPPEVKPAPGMYVYPSVFAVETGMYFELPGSSLVTASIYTPSGAMVMKVLDKSELGQGKHYCNINFNEKSLAPGIYLLDFTAGDFRKVVKLVYGQF